MLKIRLLFCLIPGLLLVAGCASTEYRDTNAAVNANPLCASRPDHPDLPVARDCERKTEAVWSSEKKADKPIDFGRKSGND